MMNDNQNIPDRILISLLPDVPFDGWTWDGVKKAAIGAGFDADMAQAVFPNRVSDVLKHFSDWADRQMLEHLQEIQTQDMRIRERIQIAVMTRMNVLYPYKEAVRAGAGFWMRPTQKMAGGKILWKSADKIWNWAGDDATDYNHYTKRALLSGVIATTMMAWLQDESGDLKETENFLARRIENVLMIGGSAGKVIGTIQKFMPFAYYSRQRKE